MKLYQVKKLEDIRLEKLMAEKGGSEISFEKVLNKIGEVENSSKYIEKSLIPRLNERFFRESMSEKDIHDKLFSLNPQKPGEVEEYMQEVAKAQGHLTPGLASEIADLVYYSSMSLDVSLKDWVKNLIEGTDVAEKVDMETARRLCILKYNFRLREKKDKETENKIMKAYLDRIQ